MVCEVPKVMVGLVAFGRPTALSFDLNTVQEGVIRMIPSIDEADVARWLTERDKTPFTGFDDFRARTELPSPVLEEMKFVPVGDGVPTAGR